MRKGKENYKGKAGKSNLNALDRGLEIKKSWSKSREGEIEGKLKGKCRWNGN
jgi:hypothetical protein